MDRRNTQSDEGTLGFSNNYDPSVSYNLVEIDGVEETMTQPTLVPRMLLDSFNATDDRSPDASLPQSKSVPLASPRDLGLLTSPRDPVFPDQDILEPWVDSEHDRTRDTFRIQLELEKKRQETAAQKKRQILQLIVIIFIISLFYFLIYLAMASPFSDSEVQEGKEHVVVQDEGHGQWLFVKTVILGVMFLLTVVSVICCQMCDTTTRCFNRRQSLLEENF